MTPLSPPSRRHALSMALGLLGSQAMAASNPPGVEAGFPAGATLVVAGPPQGRLDRWADLLLPSIDRLLPPGAAPAVARSTVGGVDGVTGANVFEARIVPDGGTALLLPGSAALAWLVGDPRAQFDAARWVPAWAGMASAVLVSRVPLTPGRTIRVAGAHPAGMALPALLALDMMGIEVTAGPEGHADAVFHCGQGARFAALAPSAMTPVMTLGGIGPGGGWSRDPAFMNVPTAIEAAARHSPPQALMAALRATAGAAMLDAALVLPQLSPANRVALWRRACAEAAATADLASEAASLGVRTAPPPAFSTLMATIAVDVPTLLALRTWLDTRWGWRAG